MFVMLSFLEFWMFFESGMMLGLQGTKVVEHLQGTKVVEHRSQKAVDSEYIVHREF